MKKKGATKAKTNGSQEVVLQQPKTLQEVRELLREPMHTEPLSEKERLIGEYLAKKYDELR